MTSCPLSPIGLWNVELSLFGGLLRRCCSWCHETFWLNLAGNLILTLSCSFKTQPCSLYWGAHGFQLRFFRASCNFITVCSLTFPLLFPSYLFWGSRTRVFGRNLEWSAEEGGVRLLWMVWWTFSFLQFSWCQFVLWGAVQWFVVV